MRMRKLKTLIVITLIISLIQPSIFKVAAGSSSGLILLYETKETKTITSGLIYEKTSKLTNLGWVDIHVLKMELENENVDLDIIRSIEEWSEKNSLTNIMSENNSVAGINGSFFDTSRNPSDIIGVEYEGDFSYLKENYNKKVLGASSMKVTPDNHIDFGYISGNISFKNEAGVSVYIGSINGTSDYVNSNVFNRNAMLSTEQIDNKAKVYKIVVENDIVIKVAQPKVVVDIPENGYVVTISEAIANKVIPAFPAGTKVELKISTNLSEKLALYDTILSGGGTILKDGQVISEGMIVDANKRHPRTAVGVTKDQKYLISMVVDGRGSSIGATHKELGNYLLEYNVYNAIHMDGGGSSTLASRELGTNSIVVNNTPSDGSQRRIVNGLGFISNAPKGTLNNIEIISNTDRVFTNMPVTYKVIGYDEYFNPVELNSSQISWSTGTINGTWKGSVFTPTSSGEGSITCYYEGLSSSKNLVVMENIIDLDVEPKVLYLKEGSVGNFSVIGTDSKGYKGSINPANINWQIDDSSLGYFNNGKFFASNKNGIGNITIKSGDVKVNAYVVIGTNTKQSTNTSFEDTSVETITYPDAAIGNATINKEIVMDKDKSIKLEYDLPKSDVTQAVYATFNNITILDSNTKGIGLSVYGNNSNLLLKGRLVDAKGEAYSVTFTNNIDFIGWKKLEATLPNMTYPVKLERIYVASLKTDVPLSGEIYFDLLTTNVQIDPSLNRFDVDIPVKDPMFLSSPNSYNFKTSVIGATKGKNRLLDSIIQRKSVELLNSSDLAIFAGYSDISKKDIKTQNIIWDNSYKKYIFDNIKVITLGTGKGGVIDTDYRQWNQLQTDLKNTSQENIIIIGNKNPINKGSFIDIREGLLLHETLKNFQNISGKTIYYINASGYQFKVNYFEGIRYIDINGLYYNISGNKLDLNNTFYILNFYLVNGKLFYNYENIYPLIQVS